MTDYKKLVKALRCNGTSMNGSCVGKKCGYYAGGFCESMRMHTDAADAIELLLEKYYKAETDATNLTGRLAQAEANILTLQEEIDKRIATEIEPSNDNEEDY